MPGVLPVSRRVFLADLGRGAAAVAVVSLVACAPSGGDASPTPTRTSASSPAPSSGSEPPAGDGVAWQRVNLGFVSAYLLIRGGEAALVDTGVTGSEDAIEAGLTGAGIDWSAVGHVILTHKHQDHAGSVEAILERATGATGYAGAEDIPNITTTKPLSAVADGDDVFGLTIVATPGHTPGHIGIYDPIAGIVLAGDALRTDGGKPSPPGAQFTEDMDLAMASIAKIGGLTFETLLPGHGDPIESGAAALVAQLATGG